MGEYPRECGVWWVNPPKILQPQGDRVTWPQVFAQTCVSNRTFKAKCVFTKTYSGQNPWAWHERRWNIESNECHWRPRQHKATIELIPCDIGRLLLSLHIADGKLDLMGRLKPQNDDIYHYTLSESNCKNSVYCVGEWQDPNLKSPEQIPFPFHVLFAFSLQWMITGCMSDALPFSDPSPPGVGSISRGDLWSLCWVVSHDIRFWWMTPPPCNSTLKRSTTGHSRCNQHESTGKER